jgi:hypothetical protein
MASTTPITLACRADIGHDLNVSQTCAAGCVTILATGVLHTCFTVDVVGLIAISSAAEMGSFDSGVVGDD